MNNINDIANERYIHIFNDNEVSNQVVKEVRVDAENEDLARYLTDVLKSNNWLPFLAVAYCGLPRTTIDRHVATAIEKGKVPAKLFMWLVRREKLWLEYKAKKEKYDFKAD